MLALVLAILTLTGICLYNWLILRKKPTTFLVVCLSVISLIYLTGLILPQA